ncbi:MULTISPECIES: hypothetical protein [Cytobacillus]|nr:MULTISPECIES: hypothetical protein [Cytobacillus]MBG9548409.1 hypothetical protein [Cytobacillus firmus]MBG9604499.1 hypothetical protein [Cytobacillus firmus]MED1942111.1 hypothetical protein [Cytobacillus firmus]
MLQMLQGICLDDSQSAVLAKGRIYYLFPNGSNHYYVSKFPNPKAHTGCFQAEMFAIYEGELWPEEPGVRVIELDPEKVYKASLIWRRQGYQSTELKEYYIEPKDRHAYFFHDRELKRCGGCYPLHWFTGFVEVTEETEQISEEIVIEFEENDLIYTEDVQEFNGYEQLSLF